MQVTDDNSEAPKPAKPACRPRADAALTRHGGCFIPDRPSSMRKYPPLTASTTGITPMIDCQYCRDALLDFTRWREALTAQLYLDLAAALTRRASVVGRRR